MSQSIETKPKVSIGMPVYNGEQFLHKRIDSLLAQTFQNCELIISDNASTDSTPSICNEYLKKDKRIRYFRQERNMGVIWNFNFVLDQAKSDYFMWAAVDDIISSNYLEKNIEILESDKNVVGSTSKMEIYEVTDDHFKSNPVDHAFK